MRRTIASLVLIALLVVPAAAQEQTIAAVAGNTADFSTLFTLLSTADLVGLLDDPDAEYTVFAPTNAAFEALPADVVTALTTDMSLLTRVLTYHVLEGAYDAEALAALPLAETMEMSALDGEAIGSSLVFTSIDGALSVNGAPVVTADVAASNGVIHIVERVLVPPDVAVELGLRPDMTDETEYVLFGTLNPAGLDGDRVFKTPAVDPEAIEEVTGLADVASVESIAFDSAGNAWVTVDLTVVDGTITSGGLLVYADFGAGTMDAPRLIAGENTGLVAAKGLQVLETVDAVAVADNGARNIKLFALEAEGDAEPLAVLSIGENGSVWDLWYDLFNDTLYAAKTNGEIAAYDGFSVTLGADGPTRLIVPTDAEGNKISVNLHGIDIDYDSNTVILTDVGDAAVNDDGQVFVISVISISDGPTPVDARIAGDQTGMGNPVDVIFDGAGIYIAEKANDTLIYYADILQRSGDLNVAPELVLPALKAESVALYPTRESKVIVDMGLMP